ncbi:hypothetical protein ElyMa_002523900 [Elysia marginata]|uniref:Uncharacterized protein n=1 Tax=Elysia marginata TaxID=1093978 RepID=A0AAV4GTM4_9GAST|nr:hypothetical protein ElyMa_002523900 [Elysia marginata]
MATPAPKPQQAASTDRTGDWPAPATVDLFYLDAPARPEDGLYTEWLETVRADSAKTLWLICENETALRDLEDASPAVARKTRVLLDLLRSSFRSHETITRKIIMNPTSTQNRQRMKKALEAAGRLKVGC